MKKSDSPKKSLWDFVPLNHSEQILAATCRNGLIADFTNQPNAAIRATFLRFLLLGGDERASVHESGVFVKGARILGTLDISNITAESSIILLHCKFEEELVAVNTTINGSMILNGSLLSKGLFAENIELFDMILLDEFASDGPFRINGAKIKGNLNCDGAQFRNTIGDSISAERICVSGDVYFRNGLRAAGQINLIGAKISGSLECDNAAFDCASTSSLCAERAEIKGSVFLRAGFIAKGKIKLQNARIHCDLDLTNSRLHDETELRNTLISGNIDLSDAMLDTALYLEAAQIEGNILLHNGFQSKGLVSLNNTRIRGDLRCDNGRFHSISAERATVDGSIFLRHGFRSTELVSLKNAWIGGDLDCSAGHFQSLSAERVKVNGSVYLREGFSSSGTVRFLNALIGGDLDCGTGKFISEPGSNHAISTERAMISGSVFFRDGFEAQGEVVLRNTQITRNLECIGAKFLHDTGNSFSAEHIQVGQNIIFADDLTAKATIALAGAQIGGDLQFTNADLARNNSIGLQGATIKGVLYFAKLKSPAQIDLRYAETGVLIDELAAWGANSIFDGLRYRQIKSISKSTTNRLSWLLIQQSNTAGKSDFSPQPWQHLQRTLREMGHFEESKQIGIAFEDQLRKTGRIGYSQPGTAWPIAIIRRLSANLFHSAFGLLACYGYRPMRLVTLILAVWLSFGLMYWWLALPPRSAIAPTDPLIFHHPPYIECSPGNPAHPGNWYLCESLRGEYSTFSPLAFSLDVILPLVDLGQQESWGAYIPTPKENPVEELFQFSFGHAARILIWIQTLFGWVSSLILVAIVSGFSRRSDEAS